MRIGVDLGTTNTVIARDGSPLTAASEGTTIVPSVVAFPPNGNTLVGSAARSRRAIDPVNTIYSSKRIIGRRWTATETQDFATRYPFTLSERDRGIAFVTRAGNFSPEEVGAHVLRHAFEEAGVLAELEGADVVVAVPAAFASAQRAATVSAARLAGVASVELIDEPLATRRAFSAVGAVSDGPVAVYDLGGGTFELAIVADGVVLGTASNLYLGGDDIDRALADLVADSILESHRWDLRDNPIVYDRLVLAAERAKRELSVADAAEISLGEVDPALPGQDEPFRLLRPQLDAVAQPIVRRTFLLCDKALADAGIDSVGLRSVVLAGGSSQLAIVSDLVSQYFDAEPERLANPMELVAIGASIA